MHNPVFADEMHQDSSLFYSKESCYRRSFVDQVVEIFTKGMSMHHFEWTRGKFGTAKRDNNEGECLKASLD